MAKTGFDFLRALSLLLPALLVPIWSPLPAEAAAQASGKKPAVRRASAKSANSVSSRKAVPAKPASARKPASAVKASAAKPAVSRAASHRNPATRRRSRRVASPWTEPTYADSTLGDSTEGEDLEVRAAAVEALGPFNGSVVVVDPDSGRILSIVNQKLALAGGFQPCSTIKVPVALAALREGVIDNRETRVPVGGRLRMDLTEALAKSNNPYFAVLGTQLGYERMDYYARLFGLGEKAGWDIPGEQPGYWPPAPPKSGGMGMLTSFGEQIRMTPLQLAAITAAIANGGTLYYLQYPRSQEEIDHFTPRVKRKLEIQDYIPEVLPGMAGAVQFGTARRILSITEEPILGKTGTCSEDRIHLGWFASFLDAGPSRLVAVVLLTGGRPSVGPTAAGIAGAFYRKLAERDYFAHFRPESASQTEVADTQSPD